jgi:Holliday junction resolvase
VRAAKVDKNQGEIVDALRKAGASVQSLAAIGKGCPDLLVSMRQQMFLMELKTGKAKPNEFQQRWHLDWQAPVHVVYSAEEALRVVGL